MRIDTNFFKIFLTLSCIFLLSVPLMGQGTVRVNEILSPDNIVIFYVGDFGLTGSKSVPIFEYELSATEYPQTLKIIFRLDATVPELDLNNTEILFAETDFFEINAAIRISNVQLAGDFQEIRDAEGNSIQFNLVEDRNIGDTDPAKRDDLIKAVLRSGKLPAGAYAFSFLVQSTTASRVDNPFESKILDITNPIELDLVEPGGDLSEELEISTTFPIFRWESEGCKYFIRVSEYDPAKHSSIEEALLNDISNLPFPDDGGYFGGDDGEGLERTFLQYPLTGAKELEYGKSYAWSVKKICDTTGRDEIIDSDIYVFKVASLAGDADAGPGAGGVITDPVISALQIIFGDAFDGLFTEDGELAGFGQVSTIVLNGETATAEAVAALAEKMLSGEITTTRYEIGELE